MLRFIKNDGGIMGLVISQIALIVATGILIASIFSLVFLNDWQRAAELQNIATSFSTMVEGMDARFFENTTGFCFPDKDYVYNVSMSTEYIVVSAQGNLDSSLSVKERFLVKLWPQNKSSVWIGGAGLHHYLKTNFGNSGNMSDPIQMGDIDNVNFYLNEEWNNTVGTSASYPFYILTNRTVYIDKAYVYSANGGKQAFIFVYQ